MKAQKAAGRAAWKGSGEASVDAVWRQVGADGLASTFVGYGHDEADAEPQALVPQFVHEIGIELRRRRIDRLVLRPERTHRSSDQDA